MVEKHFSDLNNLHTLPILHFTRDYLVCPIDPFYYINSTSETMAPVDATNNYSNETSSSRAADVHVESITRVSSIPVVKSALGLASGLYSRVKGSSPIVGSGLSRAEQTVLLVADSAKPVFQRLEKPSKYINILIKR